MTPYHQTSQATLYNAEALAVLCSLPSASVDAVLTDPPYSSGGQFRADRALNTNAKYQSSDAEKLPEFAGDSRDQRGYMCWCALWLSELTRVCKPGAMLCVSTDWRQLPTTSDALQAGGWIWRGIVPWDKVRARPQRGRFRAQAEYVLWATNGPHEASADVYGGGVLSVPTVGTSEREHMTQKPVELMLELLRVAAPTGGVILDPFMGSGTTGVAALQHGAKFIGVELSEHFAGVAKKRIEDAAPLFQEEAR